MNGHVKKGNQVEGSKSRPLSVMNMLPPDTTFVDQIAEVNAAREAKFADRMKKLSIEEETLRKKKLELLAAKERMEKQLEETKAFLRIHEEEKQKKLADIAKEKKELKKKKSEMKAQKTLLTKQLRVTKNFYEGFADEMEQFYKQEGLTQEEAATEAEVNTSASSE